MLLPVRGIRIPTGPDSKDHSRPSIEKANLAQIQLSNVELHHEEVWEKSICGISNRG